jgi:hypothetical protein
MLISKYFRLDRNQATLDFLDVPINKDLPVFVDPTALRNLNTDWAHHCVSLLQSYFDTVLEGAKKKKSLYGASFTNEKLQKAITQTDHPTRSCPHDPHR